MDIIQQQLDQKSKSTSSYVSPVQKLLKSTGQSSAGVKNLQTGQTGFKGFATGFGKGVINTATNLSEFGQTILNAPLKAVGFRTPSMEIGAKEMIPEELRTAQSDAERTGMFTEQVGEFFVPGTASTKIGKVAQGAVKGSKALGVAARLGATGLAEGVLGTGQSALQSGQLGRKEAQVGVISLLAPAVIEGFGKVASKLIPTPVKTKLVDSINKAIKPSTKSMKTPGYNDAAIKAFKVLDDNKTAFNGEIRNPQTVSETFEALKNAKQAIYSRYDDIAKQSGEMGAKFTPDKTMADVSNWIKSTGYSSDIKDYAAKRIQDLGDLNGASPALVQDRIKELNSGIKFFTSGSEKMKNQIDASIASRLRQQLDDIIFNTTGQPYQQIKNQYQVLKVVEDDIARTAANLARRGEKGFFDVTDIITGADLTTGVLTGNPASVISGATGRTIKEYMKYLNNPDTNIKKVFELIKKVPSEKSSRIATQKLLTAGTKGKSSVNVPMSLPAKTASTLDAEQVAKFGKGGFFKDRPGFARLPGKSNIAANLDEQIGAAKIDADRLLKLARESNSVKDWHDYTLAKNLYFELQGYINRANKSVPKLNADDVKYLEDFVDIVRAKDFLSKDLEINAKKIAEGFNIDTTLSNAQIANKLTPILDEYISKIKGGLKLMPDKWSVKKVK